MHLSITHLISPINKSVLLPSHPCRCLNHRRVSAVSEHWSEVSRTHWPRTCCSRLRITFTAWWRTSSFVWGFSLFMCIWHMRPSSLKASLMSRTRKRSRALLATRRSFSRSAFTSIGKSSSSSSSSWLHGSEEQRGERGYRQNNQGTLTGNDARVPHVKVLKRTNQKLLEVGMSSISSVYWCTLTSSQKFGIIMTF